MRTTFLDIFDAVPVRDGSVRDLLPTLVAQKSRRELFHLTQRPEFYQDEQDLQLQILKEELDIQKQTRITGIVRLEKTVRTTEAAVDEDLVRDSISVEHVPVNRYIDEVVDTRQEGDTTIIPILEEIVIITKQLVLKEEIRITRRREQSHYHETVSLRAEEVEVKRLGPR